VAARCLVIGAGDMALRHLEALRALLPGRCACWAPSERGRASVEGLGVPFYAGALPEAVQRCAPSHALVAVPAERLVEAARAAVDAGVARLLVEKPGALDLRSGGALLEAAEARGARLWVGYNRRYYASVHAAQERLRAASEGVQGAVVEFTEFAEQVAALPLAAEVKRRWVLVNSMHPLDLGFLEIGLPDPQHSWFQRQGGLPWHPAAARMAGSGLTERGVPFVIHADWAAPGRWGVEWLSASARYVFRPLEQLRIATRGGLEPELQDIPDELDRRFKPGLYRQAADFLADEPSRLLPPFSHALRLVSLAAAIAGYDAERQSSQ
jgi:hypothetical protein